MIPPPPPRPPPAPCRQTPGEVDAKVKVKVKSCYQSPLRLEYGAALEAVKEAVGIELERAGQDQDSGQTLAIYRPLLNPILQNGPVCGLIALIEGVQILVGDRGINLDPDALLQEAIRLGMTKHGEIFSALYMQQLAESYFHLEARVVDTTAMDFESIWRLLGSHLLQGKVALVPYDADYNHGPSLRKGHAAHWAVIHGITIPDLDTASAANEQKSIKVMDPTKSENQSQSSKIFDPTTNSRHSSSKVLAHHGKSLRIAVWPFSDLMESNRNLMEISPKIMSAPPEEQYVLCDIKTELCSKLVLLGMP